jgi:hypothetical protein
MISVSVFILAIFLPSKSHLNLIQMKIKNLILLLFSTLIISCTSNNYKM